MQSFFNDDEPAECAILESCDNACGVSLADKLQLGTWAAVALLIQVLAHYAA